MWGAQLCSPPTKVFFNVCVAVGLKRWPAAAAGELMSRGLLRCKAWRWSDERGVGFIAPQKQERFTKGGVARMGIQRRSYNKGLQWKGYKGGVTIRGCNGKVTKEGLQRKGCNGGDTKEGLQEGVTKKGLLRVYRDNQLIQHGHRC